jgi:hypothetical protein
MSDIGMGLCPCPRCGGALACSSGVAECPRCGLTVRHDGMCHDKDGTELPEMRERLLENKRRNAEEYGVSLG